MIVSLVLAVAENGVIGKDNQLPWHLPADLKHFKQLTSGHVVIMGRKTFESIGRPLPNRRNLVISRNEGFGPEGVEVFSSLGEGLKACLGEDEVFVIGGGTIYSKVLELDVVERIYRTLVHAEVEGDTHFQLPADKGWMVVQSERLGKDEKNVFECSFQILERRLETQF